MWWRKNPDHEPCRRAIETLQKICDSQRAQIDSLHDKLVAMHGTGVGEHERALQHRVKETELEAQRLSEKLRRALAGEAPIDLPLDTDPILVHDPDKSVAVEHFGPLPPASPDPTAATDE